MTAGPITTEAAFEGWLIAELINDLTIAGLVGTRIYSILAPQGTAYPLVTFSQQSGNDEAAMDGTRALTEANYLIQAHDQSLSMATVSAIADRISTLLDGAVITGINLQGHMRRAQPVRSAEVLEGDRYNRAGAFWTVLLQGVITS